MSTCSDPPSEYLKCFKHEIQCEVSGFEYVHFHCTYIFRVTRTLKYLHRRVVELRRAAITRFVDGRRAREALVARHVERAQRRRVRRLVPVDVVDGALPELGAGPDDVGVAAVDGEARVLGVEDEEGAARGGRLEAGEGLGGGDRVVHLLEPRLLRGVDRSDGFLRRMSVHADRFGHELPNDALREARLTLAPDAAEPMAFRLGWSRVEKGEAGGGVRERGEEGGRRRRCFFLKGEGE